MWQINSSKLWRPREEVIAIIYPETSEPWYSRVGSWRHRLPQREDTEEGISGIEDFLVEASGLTTWSKRKPVWS